MATTAGTLALLTGLVGTAQATPVPSPSDSLGPTQSAAPAPPPPSPSPSPSPPSGANQPPQIDCPGLVTEAGDTESVRIVVLDPDGDTITLSAGRSWLGGEATVEGHVVTYTAPTDARGGDGVTVTADDGRGGTSECEISIVVQPGPSPTPTPTPPPTVTPTPTSPAPTPNPTSSAPDPSPEPTSGSGTPTRTPTSAPAPAPSHNPTTPGGLSPSSGAPTGPPGSGNGGNGNGGNGAAPGGSASADAGGSGSGGDGADGGGSESQTPDGTGSPSEPTAEASSAQKLSNIIRDTAIACPVRAVADAEKLVAGISAGMTSRPGGGNFPSGNAAEDTGSAEPVAAADRTAHTGSTLWLFAGVGFMMIALIALALAAVPRGGRRH
ncbi:Ig-like domain-containing protein [Citricoccus sp. NPDC079358]|uniref:Ig-like domain-containing protein n=1 Tax=Citricoccus sp. NPDC079358 TaxID=3154653 RepID=UPI00344D38D9